VDVASRNPGESDVKPRERSDRRAFERDILAPGSSSPAAIVPRQISGVRFACFPVGHASLRRESWQPQWNRRLRAPGVATASAARVAYLAKLDLGWQSAGVVAARLAAGGRDHGVQNRPRFDPGQGVSRHGAKPIGELTSPSIRVIGLPRLQRLAASLLAR